MEVSNKDCKTQVGKNLGSLPFSKNAEKIFLVKGFQHLCDQYEDANLFCKPLSVVTVASFTLYFPI